MHALVKLSLPTLIVFAAFSLLAGCGDDNDDGPSGNNGVLPAPDIGTDTGSDVEDDSPEEDTGPDIEEDAEPDVEEDVPPPDRDRDNIPDDEDNCPDVINPAQFDADGDGIGDSCDTCEFIPDPSNDPTTCEPIPEEEPNEDPFDLNFLDLPFFVEGTVQEVEGPEYDEDWFAFTVEPGTALNIRIDADENTQFWAVAAVIGLDFENFDYQRVLYTPNLGTGNERELFIGTPGDYAIIVTDLRNLIIDPQDVGGDTFRYVLSVRETSITPMDANLIPFSQQVEFDETLHVWAFGGGDNPAVQVSAEGASFDANALIQPSVIVYDPEQQLVLAETNMDQIDDMQSVVTLALTPADSNLLLVLDPIAGFGPNATTVSLNAVTAETEQEPNDNVALASPVLVPGSVSGRIDVPKPSTSAPERLVADVDYYLFAASEGDHLVFSVQRKGNFAEMDALLELGTVDFGFFYSDYTGREIGGDPDAQIEWVAPADGLYYARIRDENNLFVPSDEDPVGGLDYNYDFIANPGTITPVATLTAPDEVTGEFVEHGRSVWYQLTAEPNNPIEIRTSAMGGAQVSSFAWAAADMSLLGGSEFGSTYTVLLPEGGDFWIQVHERGGRAGAPYGFTLTLTTREVVTIDELPAREPGVLETTGERDLYGLDVATNQLIDVRVALPDDSSFNFPIIEVFDAADLATPLATYYRDHALLQFPEDMSVLLQIRDQLGGGGTEYDYTLAVTEISPESFDDFPVNLSGSLAADGDAYWFTVPVEETDILRGVSGGSADFDPEVIVYDMADFSVYGGTASRTFSLAPGETTTLLVGVADTRNQGGHDYVFDLTRLDATPVTLPYVTIESFETEGDRTYVPLEAPEGSLIGVSVVAEEADSPLSANITLRRGDNLNYLAGSGANSPLFYLARDEGSYFIEINDVANGFGAEYDFTLRVDVVTPTAATLGTDLPAQSLSASGFASYLVSPAADAVIRVGITPATDLTANVRAIEADGGFETYNGQLGLLFDAPEPYVVIIWDSQRRADLEFDLSLTDLLVSLTERPEVEPNDGLSSTDTIGSLPALVRGAIESDTIIDEDWYPVDLQAGDLLHVLTAPVSGGVGLDSTIRVVTSDNTQLAFDDDDGRGRYSAINDLTIEEDGTYFVIVRPFGSSEGDYYLAVDVD